MAAVCLLAIIGSLLTAPTTASADPASPAAPAFPQDFPDPTVMTVGSTYYAYSTQVYLAQVPVVSSTDLVHWSAPSDALPRLPSWASWGYTWAPTVAPDGNGGYVLFYTARKAWTNFQCIGRAVSPTPLGPFVDSSRQPFVCQTSEGGSIDPSIFTDSSGQSYLLWKSDSNAIGMLPHIYAAPLSAGLGAFTAAPSQLIGTTQAWEGAIIEGPSLVQNGSSYELLFAGNDWWTDQYAIGHATCRGPMGPCAVDTSDPVGISGPTFAGPGAPSFFRGADGQLLLAFHAWMNSVVGYPGGSRALYITTVRFSGHFPLFGSLSPQPPSRTYGKVASIGGSTPPSSYGKVASIGGSRPGAPAAAAATVEDRAQVSTTAPPPPTDQVKGTGVISDAREGTPSSSPPACAAQVLPDVSSTGSWLPAGWRLAVWQPPASNGC